ncbi:FlgO family outer membrane protein [Pseudoalteromonas rubra]|uniref:FlgO domain-containing protein n=1 Tax=Pseudoalteromonas rubra TaxID=43658 RepID=A0A5S3X0Y9_9GAMM|nr:FlgO family outer membrane protein [Pseudoalteromonas rubra]TMP37050.1 hypothetical protein CWB98_12140 [Pseudoalteromonas rubra]
MKKSVIALMLPTLSLFGCAQLGMTKHQETTSAPGQFNASEQFQAHPRGVQQMTVSQRMAAKNVTHYVQKLMQDMVSNVKYINDQTPVAVSSFVFLDEDFNHATLLGNQIAESFIHELHNFGVPVIDFKTTDFMRVTKHGDFIFSRDFLELSDELPFKYVLAGTLTHHQGGILVNARIVGMQSKVVVGTAQGFLPQAVVNALRDGAIHEGIRLQRAGE